MRKHLLAILRDEDGVTAVEYSMIALLILVGIVVSVSLMGSVVSRSFNTVGSAINASATH